MCQGDPLWNTIPDHPSFTDTSGTEVSLKKNYKLLKHSLVYEDKNKKSRIRVTTGFPKRTSSRERST